MGKSLDLVAVEIEKPGDQSDDVNVILGQAHFIKTVEDLHEALVGSAPGIRFGIAFCEASGPALVRWSGNDDELVECARHNALALAAGHVFVIMLRGAYPINVLGAVKAVPEVCSVFCATANPLTVIVAETGQGRGVVGVIDGARSAGIETAADVTERKLMLRRFGYKL